MKIKKITTRNQIWMIYGNNQPGVFDQSLLALSWVIYYYPVYKIILIIVNTNQGSKRHNYGNLMERCQSQQVIRNQPSAETVYEKRGTVRTVNKHRPATQSFCSSFGIYSLRC